MPKEDSRRSKHKKIKSKIHLLYKFFNHVNAFQ